MSGDSRAFGREKDIIEKSSETVNTSSTGAVCSIPDSDLPLTTDHSQVINTRTPAEENTGISNETEAQEPKGFHCDTPAQHLQSRNPATASNHSEKNEKSSEMVGEPPDSLAADAVKSGDPEASEVLESREMCDGENIGSSRSSDEMPPQSSNARNKTTLSSCSEIENKSLELGKDPMNPTLQSDEMELQQLTQEIPSMHLASDGTEDVATPSEPYEVGEMKNDPDQEDSVSRAVSCPKILPSGLVIVSYFRESPMKWKCMMVFSATQLMQKMRLLRKTTSMQKEDKSLDELRIVKQTCHSSTVKIIHKLSSEFVFNEIPSSLAYFLKILLGRTVPRDRFPVIFGFDHKKNRPEQFRRMIPIEHLAVGKFGCLLNHQDMDFKSLLHLRWCRDPNQTLAVEGRSSVFELENVDAQAQADNRKSATGKWKNKAVRKAVKSILCLHVSRNPNQSHAVEDWSSSACDVENGCSWMKVDGQVQADNKKFATEKRKKKAPRKRVAKSVLSLHQCINQNESNGVNESSTASEVENVDAPVQADINKSTTGKWRKKFAKKGKKFKRAAKSTRKFLRKFVCCGSCETGTKEGSSSHKEIPEPSKEAHFISLKTFYPNVEIDNKQPPGTLYEDEYERWATFHRLANQRLPTQTLARKGLFCSADDKVQCYSCRRVSELYEAAHSPASGNWHYSHCRYAERPRQVLSDTPGRVSDDIRDPPGQQSIYIPPGDVRVEAYRVSTFENFPVPSTSSRRSLAQAGFFFTGFYDRVKCFACGRTVQEWEARDNPADRKWHKDDCPFMRGENCGNVPITTHFNQIYGNLSTRPSPRNPGEEVIQQRDPVTGAVIRTVRYPADLPKRIRQTGGMFEIGPNNQVTIQSGPGAAGRNRGPGLQEAPARLPATPLQQSQHQPMRNWRMANVISADHKRFLTNLYLNRELDRLASFARWPTGRPNVSLAALARTGFFYLGDMDRTQCFSCGVVLRNWAHGNDASEHRAHFPNCRLLLGTETRNVPVPASPVPPQVRHRDFPCRFPSTPHMGSEAARGRTFDQRWLRNRTAATPAEMAQAGFFYLGESVKCWYCNGGLQDWEYDYVPWIEHAKWFPNCQYLLNVKGQHFVYQHLARYPHLPRPVIARQDGSPLESGHIHPTAAKMIQPFPPPTSTDTEEMRKKQERIDNVLKNSGVVKSVLEMGFSAEIVLQVLVEKVFSGGEDNLDNYSSEALVEDILNTLQETEQEEGQRPNVTTAVPWNSGSSEYMLYPSTVLEDEGVEDMEVDETSENDAILSNQVKDERDNAALQEALRKMEEEKMCKVCFSNPADMVFVPCSHMCCCMECTQALQQCPICRMKIERAIKTYLS